MRGRGVLVFLLLWGPGCGNAGPGGMVTTDGGSRPDGARRMDTDGDGLCDDTERRIRTDSRRADTDGDGLLDSLETMLGTDPLSSLDPPPSDRLSYVEAPGGMSSFEQFLDYQGMMGEVVTGAIQDRGVGTDGRAALGVGTFLVQAVDADPAAYVAGVMGPAFIGVLGLTTLHWRVSVQPMDGIAPIGCRRGYGYVFIARRSGGTVVQEHAMVLDVVPAAGGDAGVSPDGGTAAWPRVSPEGLCLPMPPCM